jgi:hypothetical protein
MTIDALIQSTVARMKDEILCKIAFGKIPESVSSFSQLHNYIDANTLGGFCDDVPSDDVIETLNSFDEFDSFMTECQAIVHQWLVDGGHRDFWSSPLA